MNPPPGAAVPPPPLTQADVRRLEFCLGADGVAVFPCDTVYGLGCAHDSDAGMRRLLALKGRPAARPMAVMAFEIELGLALIPWIRPRTREVLRALLPGPLTAVLEDTQERFGGPTVGLRVPALAPALSALATVGRPMLQSSANLSGEPPARCLEDVAPSIRAGADLVLDGGELPGVASTVLDLTAYERDGTWSVTREGAVTVAELAARLG